MSTQAAFVPSTLSVTPVDQLLFRIDEAGRILAISRRSVYRLIAEGKLRVVRLNSRSVRISRRELQRIAEELGRSN